MMEMMWVLVVVSNTVEHAWVSIKRTFTFQEVHDHYSSLASLCHSFTQ